MKLLRTPDDRFRDLPGFPFDPHYTDVTDPDSGSTSVRVHFLDEGPADGPVVLLLHGEPSWCFLYRTMIPVLVDAGFRCIAPDLVGFGRSDKPADRNDHSYARHVEWLREALFDNLGLRDINLFAQDWGGLLGLRLVAEHPDRFARVIVANTGLGTGDKPAQDGFLAWQKYSQETPVFDAGKIVAGGCTSAPSASVVDAYNAPFPDDSYMEAPRMMPTLVPGSPDNPASQANRDAWAVLGTFERPLLTLFSDCDPVTAGGERTFQFKVPGAAGQPHTTIEGAGHFLQEDAGPAIAARIVDFIESTPAD
jgi:haloalkane dehalogenase